VLDLMKIFDGYVRNYHSLNLTVDHGRHSFTMTEIEYFSRLDSMLGYYAFTEDTCNGESRPMDLTWWDGHDADSWDDFVLHLERENQFAKDEETLEKLFGDREYIPQNVIGIMNVASTERIQYLVSVATETCRIQNALLIFKTYSPGKPQPYFDEVHAYLLTKHEIKQPKKAHVSLVEGMLFMHFNETLEVSPSPHIK